MPLFDIMLLGVGEDGHTASLLPGHPVLAERTRWVAAVAHGRPEVRITLTYPAIDSSRHVAFLLQGQSKAAIFAEIRSGRSTCRRRGFIQRATSLVRRPRRRWGVG